MKWMFRRTVVSWLAIVGLSSLAPAAIVEHHLVIDPILAHNTGDTSGVYNVSSGVELALPAFTLSPGDTLRVTVELAGGKSLKMIPVPPDGSQSAQAQVTILQRSFGGWPGDGDGATDTVQIYNAQLQPIFDQTAPSSYWIDPDAEELHSVTMLHALSGNLGESMDYTFRKWVFEVEMPTTIVRSGGDGTTFPFVPTTFDRNYFHLSFSSTRFGQPLGFDQAVYVVPEPDILWLSPFAVFSVLTCRNRR